MFNVVARCGSTHPELSTQGGLQTLGQPGLHGDSPSQIVLFNIYITVKMNMTFPKV